MDVTSRRGRAGGVVSSGGKIALEVLSRSDLSSDGEDLLLSLNDRYDSIRGVAEVNGAEEGPAIGAGDDPRFASDAIEGSRMGEEGLRDNTGRGVSCESDTEGREEGESGEGGSLGFETWSGTSDSDEALIPVPRESMPGIESRNKSKDADFEKLSDTRERKDALAWSARTR